MKPALIPAALALGAAWSSAPAADVVVNGQTVAPAAIAQLERAYGVPIQPGRYWYDPLSGVWGVEGGPGAGQIHPGLARRATPSAFEESAAGCEFSFRTKT